MSSKQHKAYFFAPSFDIPPDGPIRLGDIITDPADPLHNLGRLPDDDSSGKGERLKPLEGPEARKANLWTSFQKAVSMSFGDPETKFEIETLETLQYKPTIAELAQRMSDPRLKEYFKSPLKKKTAYMVTGLKIARGLRIRKLASQAFQGSVGDSAAVSGGGQAAISWGKETETNTEDSSIVFAYSLTSLRVKGWWKKEKELITEPYVSGPLF
jgi:hypothetical protein